MPTYPSPAPVRAVLDLSGAQLRIRASDRDDTVVDVRPHNPGSSGDVELAAQTTVEYADGRLTVRTARGAVGRFKAMFGAGARLDVDVDLPSGSSVEARGWGDAVLEGGFADVDVDISMGEVRVAAADRLRAKTSMGEVHVGVVHGHAELESSAGSIRIDRVGAGLVAKTSMGDVVVGEGDGELRLTSSMGDVRVERALGPVSARTSSGDVRVASVRAGAVDLNTTYGGCHVGIAQGTAVWLDLDARHGVVNNELQGTDGPGDAEQTVELRAVTGYGDITLRRVPA